MLGVPAFKNDNILEMEKAREEEEENDDDEIVMKKKTTQHGTKEHNTVISSRLTEGDITNW